MHEMGWGRKKRKRVSIQEDRASHGFFSLARGHVSELIHSILYLKSVQHHTCFNMYYKMR